MNRKLKIWFDRHYFSSFLMISLFHLQFFIKYFANHIWTLRIHFELLKKLPSIYLRHFPWLGMRLLHNADQNHQLSVYSRFLFVPYFPKVPTRFISWFVYLLVNFDLPRIFLLVKYPSPWQVLNIFKKVDFAKVWASFLSMESFQFQRKTPWLSLY